MVSLVIIPAVIGPFASGWMLWWGLAAMIPVVVHLWSRRRYQEVPWAAMEFLLAAAKKNARRIRIEQLLLLLLRVLVVLLLALALADPDLAWLSGRGLLAGFGGDTHHVLVLDASFSMAVRRGEKSLFELAQEQAIQLVQNTPQGDGFTLILLADPPRTIIGQPTFDRTTIAEEIRGAAPIHGGARLRATLAEAESVIRKARDRQPRLKRHQISIYSDMGRTTWEESEDSGCRAQLQRLAESASLDLTMLGDGSSENLAVTRLAVRESLVTVGRMLSFEVEVRNFGDRDVSGIRLEFIVDGQVQEQGLIDVAAGAPSSSSFGHRFELPGEHYVEVVLRDDALAIDNHRWLSIPVRESMNVLCLEGTPGEAAYLRLALEPTHDDRPRVRPVVADQSAILEGDLARFDAIFLCNIARFGVEERSALASYLRQGGGLVVFLGDQVETENYNEILAAPGADRVVPARLGSPVSGTDLRVNAREYAHPLVAPFQGQERTGLLSTPIWRYCPLQLIDPKVGRIALAFDQGGPLIVDEAIGKGRCLLFATAASTQSLDRTTAPTVPWTALPTWPSFVPLIQESLNLLASGRSADRNLAVGEPFQSVGPSPDPNLVLTLAGPADSQGRFEGGERVRVTVEGDQSVWSHAGTDRSGVFQASAGEQDHWLRWFAANVDTKESELTSYATDRLPIQFRADATVPTPPGTSVGADERRSLFRYLLTGVFVLMLLESIVASSLASGRRRETG